MPKYNIINISVKSRFARKPHKYVSQASSCFDISTEARNCTTKTSLFSYFHLDVFLSVSVKLLHFNFYALYQFLFCLLCFVLFCIVNRGFITIFGTFQRNISTQNKVGWFGSKYIWLCALQVILVNHKIILVHHFILPSVSILQSLSLTSIDGVFCSRLHFILFAWIIP